LRVAALYDIHSNLPALEAVVEEIHRDPVDRIVVGGDVFPGPFPRETFKRLTSLDIPLQFIKGNADREVHERMLGRESDSVPERFREAIRWAATELNPDYEEMIAGWPQTLRLEIPGIGKTLFCHATPRNDTEVFTRLTPEDKLLPVLKGVDSVLVVCGHTHMQVDRTIGKIRVVNAGSVGMPYGEPGAHWLLLGPDVQHKVTRYDLEKAATNIRKSRYPLAQDFARNVVQPPTLEETLKAFRQAELK